LTNSTIFTKLYNYVDTVIPKEAEMRKWTGILFTVMLLMGLLMQACSKTGEQSGQTAAQPGSGANMAGDNMQTGRSDFEKASEKKLEEFRARLDELRSTAEARGNEFAKQHQEELDQLEKQIRNTQARLDELKKSSKDAWGHLREGFDKAAKDMDDALDKAGEDFKN
jgi:DNA anti-recombination protein RmuC